MIKYRSDGFIPSSSRSILGKLYFLQSDIDHFNQMENSLDNRIKTGDLSFAHDVYKVYLQRLDERVPVIDKLIDAETDFTVDESIDTDFESRKYPRDAKEAEERWRKQIKYDLLLQKAAEVEAAEGSGEVAPPISHICAK